MGGAAALVHPWGTPVVGGVGEGGREGVSERVGEEEKWCGRSGEGMARP